VFGLLEAGPPFERIVDPAAPVQEWER